MDLILRQERLKRGWKQFDVAKKCGVSIQTVCDWENNRRKPSYSVLVKLEDFFQLGHRELFQTAIPGKAEENTNNLKITQKKAKVKKERRNEPCGR